MKLKKLLCPLLAGAMLCGGAALPVAAEEATTYQMGDVDMNGVVDIDDAIQTLRHYVMVYVVKFEEYFSEEQIALANVCGFAEEELLERMVENATYILRYSVQTNTLGRRITMAEFVQNGY